MMLEECDKQLMRNLFNAEIGTPIESFFIETFTIPLRFILQGRRIMYLWTILQKSESELLAMQEFPVSQDLADCAIFCTQKEISKMYKFKFKQIVKHLARPRLGSALARLY